MDCQIMKQSFTWDDYVKIGYNDGFFNKRSHVNDVMKFSFNPSIRKNYGFNEEAIITANIMDEHYGVSNMSILYSGGIDSEFIAKSFLLYGKVPDLVFLDFGFNSYDKNKAISFAKGFNLKLHVIELDVVNLHDSGESFDLCKKYQSSQSGYAPYLKAIELLSKSSYLILGDDPVFECKKIGEDFDWYYCVREHTFSWWKAFYLNGQVGCPNFILYSPELFYSFINTRRMKHLFSQSETLTSSAIKPYIFREAMGLSLRYKMTGTESILDRLSMTNKRIYNECDLCVPDTTYIPVKQLISTYENNSINNR
jgi:hypothetical protein